MSIQILTHYHCWPWSFGQQAGAGGSTLQPQPTTTMTAGNWNATPMSMSQHVVCKINIQQRANVSPDGNLKATTAGVKTFHIAPPAPMSECIQLSLKTFKN